MRVTCFFVTVAIMLAEQATAAPIAGLPSLPILGNEGRLVHSVSTTLVPVPILGGLGGDLLESESEGDLLSATKLTGPGGLIKAHSRVGEIAGSLQRRQALPLMATLGHLTAGLQAMPLLASGASIAPPVTTPSIKLAGLTPVATGLTSELTPITKGLTSDVTPLTKGLTSDVTPVTHDLTSNVGGLKGVVHGTTDALPINVSTKLPALVKRDGLSSLFGAVPGFSQIGAMPGVSALESIPGLNKIESMGSALPMPLPGLAKRDGGIPVLGALPVVSSLGGFKELPGISTVPVVGSQLPAFSSLPVVDSLPLGAGLPGIGQISSLTSALPIGGLLKRDGLPLMGSLPGVGALPSVPGMSSLPSMSSLPLVSSMPSAASMPGLSSLPKLPSMGSLPEISSVPVIGGMTSGLPGMGSLTSFL